MHDVGLFAEEKEETKKPSMFLPQPPHSDALITQIVRGLVRHPPRSRFSFLPLYGAGPPARRPYYYRLPNRAHTTNCYRLLAPGGHATISTVALLQCVENSRSTIPGDSGIVYPTLDERASIITVAINVIRGVAAVLQKKSNATMYALIHS